MWWGLDSQCFQGICSQVSQNLVNRYPVSHYLEQRLEIQEFGINSLFESDKSKQSSLDVFFGK
ncbi:hypothetical protein [uncultured Methanobrevibacter sp.]|uniref:hypothetical protein n=1 Tax=uncultured Methanobrevibacter sp. TaxID=253161 RepID=UPI0037435CBD